MNRVEIEINDLVGYLRLRGEGYRVVGVSDSNIYLIK